MDTYNNIYNSNEISTYFSSDTVIKLINEFLSKLVKPKNYTISEVMYNPLYDKFDLQLATSKIWIIELYKFDFNNYVIRVIFFKRNKNEPNLVRFIDCHNVGYVCENILSSLKYNITKREKKLILTYIEREPLLLLIKSSITNYDDFSDEDLEKIKNEKKISKKRQVLENYWFQREISEYLDIAT
jgi:hypothetical protein